MAPPAASKMAENSSSVAVGVNFRRGRRPSRSARAAPGWVGASGFVGSAVVACARVSRVDNILTFNERHFAPFAHEDLAIVAPS